MSASIFQHLQLRKQENIKQITIEKFVLTVLHRHNTCRFVSVRPSMDFQAYDYIYESKVAKNGFSHAQYYRKTIVYLVVFLTMENEKANLLDVLFLSQ